MTPRIVDHIRSIAPAYDWFIVDQWGVLHDGHTAHPGAVEALRHLRAHGPVALISNTSRRIPVAEAVLQRLGFPPHLYDACFTAGELAARWLEDHITALGRTARVHSLLGPPGPTSMVASLDVVHTPEIDHADVILVAGTHPGPRTTFDPILRAGLTRGLPLLCANPDVRSIQPNGSFLWCPGAFAERYEQLGGTVHRFGKPGRALYTAARTVLGDPGRGLAFGDSLEHDVRGAHNAGLAIGLVTRGIHGPDLGLSPLARPCPDRVAQLAQQYGTSVDYAMATFRW